MFGYLAAAAAAAYAYANRAKIATWLENKKILPPSGVIPGVPSSWTYQGPPVQPAPASGGATGVTVQPGALIVVPKTGDTLTVSLPAGGTWAAQDADLIPTALGGTVTSDSTVSLTAPLVVTGVAGSAVVVLNWVDPGGTTQQTLLTVTAQ